MEAKSLNKDFEQTKQDSELKFGTQIVKCMIHVCTEAFYNNADILLMGVSNKFQHTSKTVFPTTSHMITLLFNASV